VSEHYDVVIVGTGVGGGTLANVLAHSGRTTRMFPERTVSAQARGL
jgi:choline dehydrogenase-like flavoprotein